MLTGIEYYKHRYKKARATADLWISILEACYHYSVPSRNLFYWTSQYQGSQKNARVYDTTAVAGLRQFVSKAQSALTPPQQVWAGLAAGVDVSEDEKERVNLDLQEITNKVFNYIHRSNFDTAISECYYDLGIGTGALICNEGPDDSPLQFYSVPMARLAIEDSVNGKIESVYRWWDEIKVMDIMTMWPKAKIPALMKDLYKQDPTAVVKEFVEALLYIPGKPFKYILMWQEYLLIEEDVESSNWIVFRWSKINNEAYGRGPVLDALPSILSLQELARLELVTANFNAAKPYMGYSDGIFNPWTFKIQPNTIIPIAPRSDGNSPIMPFPDNQTPQFYQLTATDLRFQINKLLYADPIGPLDQAPDKTATELVIRQKQFAEEIGPLFARIQSELLAPLMKRIIYILQKKGLIEALVIDGKTVEIKYESPLVFAQGQQDMQRFAQWYQLMQSVQGPEAALININPAKLPGWSARKMGVDPTPLNTEEQIEKMLDEQSQQAQEQDMAMMEQQGMMEGAFAGA